MTREEQNQLWWAAAEKFPEMGLVVYALSLHQTKRSVQLRKQAYAKLVKAMGCAPPIKPDWAS